MILHTVIFTSKTFHDLDAKDTQKKKYSRMLVITESHLVGSFVIYRDIALTSSVTCGKFCNKNNVNMCKN